MESWFCPLEPAGGGWSERRQEDAGRLALSSYQTLVAVISGSRGATAVGGSEGGASSSTSKRPPPPSPSILSFVLPLLAQLSIHYPLSKLYPLLFHSNESSKAKATVLWESFARTIVSIPGKVLNATEGGRRASIPKELEQGAWFAGLTKEMEVVVKMESERTEPG